MTKYFPGITHVIINTAPNQSDMTAMQDTIATAEICFGPGDDNILGPVYIRKLKGVVGVQAHTPKSALVVNGKTKYVPVFTGKLFEELRVASLVAFDIIQQKGGVKYNKRYRVTGKNVEEITPDAKCSAGVGQQSTV